MYVCGITPVRRHPPRARRDLPGLRPRAAGLARRRPRRRTTCRTSPTSTTRCSSGRSATARTGGRSPTGRRTCSATDMTALRVLPPDDYVGAVEAIPQIVAADRSGCCDPGAAYHVDGRHLLLGRLRRPASAYGRRSTSTTMRALSAERGGDPERPGKKDPLDPLLWRAARPGEPSWDSDARPGPARLARRVHRHRAGPARHGASTCRAAAATWSSRTTRCAPRTPRCATGELAVRPGVRARRDGRARRREDVQVARQPRAGVPAARGRRRPDGGPARRCWPTTTAATGSGRGRRCRGGRGAAGALAAGGVARRRAARPSRCWPGTRARSPTTWTRPAALAAVDRWADEALTRGGPSTAAPGLVATSSTRCSASAVGRRDPVGGVGRLTLTRRPGGRRLGRRDGHRGPDRPPA